jgi:hypothetical protein
LQHGVAVVIAGRAPALAILAAGALMVGCQWVAGINDLKLTADASPGLVDVGNGGSSSGEASSGRFGGDAAPAGSSTGGGSSGASGSSSGNGSSSGADASADSASSGGSSDAGDAGGLVTYGSPYTGGQYDDGSLDYAETQWHNACAPTTKYDPRVQQVEGTLLAGLSDSIPNVSGYCDACIWVTTDMGKSALLRVVTYGSLGSDITTSTDAYSILSAGEYPRAMTWQFAECPDTGPILYEFKTASSEFWTSLWVRNARVPLTTIEVQSPNHPSWTALSRGSDGSLTDTSGFGNGSFSIRSTGVDGQVVVDMFGWPTMGIAGALLTGSGNFH